MRAIGVLTTVLMGAALAGAVVVAIRSLPDVQRYLKIRAM